jgi:hypothetical protein
MNSTNGLKETTRATPSVASNTLSVNVFTAPGKDHGRRAAKVFGRTVWL